MMTMDALAFSTAADDVLCGLRAPRKTLPCRLLYDARGAELFERICTLDEYYLTRSEVALLAEQLPAFARTIGPGVRVIEPGSGEGIKTRMLLSALDAPAGYVPIDVSSEQLERTAESLRAEFPGLEVAPVCADYTTPFQLPAHERSLVFFPGSTIGNFEPEAATNFLARFRGLAGPRGMLLLGADCNRDCDSLLRAYDDREGVTAEFDLNMLAHLNHSRGTDFDLDAFMHRAVWNAARSRVEMHLVSKRRQSVRLGDEVIHFERGEPIVTEHCYKHSASALATILADAGWEVARVACDSRERMHLWLAT